MSKRTDAASIGSLLETTAWDYSAEDAGVGLLTPMSSFFRAFPWEGRAPDDRAAPGRGEVEEGLAEEELDRP